MGCVGRRLFAHTPPLSNSCVTSVINNTTTLDKLLLSSSPIPGAKGIDQIVHSEIHSRSPNASFLIKFDYKVPEDDNDIVYG